MKTGNDVYMILDIIAFSTAFTIVLISLARCKKMVYLQILIATLLVESFFVGYGSQMFSLLPVMMVGTFFVYRQDKKLYDSFFSASLTVILLTIGVIIAAIPLSAFLPQGLYNYSMSVFVILYSLLCKFLINKYFPRRVVKNTALLIAINATGMVIVIFISIIGPLFLSYRMETLPFFILFTVFLLFIVAFFVYALNVEKEKNRQEYNQFIEKQYGEINRFQHYYAKLYRSLSRYVIEKDMDGVAEIFQKYIVPEHLRNIEKGMDYELLAMVKLPLINGLLYDTATSLHQKNILLNLNIEGTIATQNIKELDLFKILTHLIENAVQETEGQEKGYINIFLSEDGSGTNIQIENTLESCINISLVYEEGYTTKEDHVGSGLPEVRRIADSYPNVSLSTYRQCQLFKQNILIK